VFVLTEEEKRYLVAMGDEPKERIVYCRPCTRIMRNQATALDLMKGVVQVQATALGVPNAEALAEGFKNQLLEKTKKP